MRARPTLLVRQQEARTGAGSSPRNRAGRKSRYTVQVPTATVSPRAYQRRPMPGRLARRALLPTSGDLATGGEVARSAPSG